jgi:hypothetical protein
MTAIATPQVSAAAPSSPVASVQLELSQTLGRLIGQIVSGTVTTLLNDTTLRLQTPAGVLDVAADMPLRPGTAVTIAVQGTPQQPQIVITPVTDGVHAPPTQQAGVSEEPSPEPAAANAAPANSAASASTTAATAGDSSPAAAAETVSQPSVPARMAAPPPPAAVSTATAIVRDAAATQGSLATLYADVEAAVSTPTPSLPAPVLDAARLLLAMRFTLPSGQNVAAPDAGDAGTALMRASLSSTLPTFDAAASTPSGTNLAAALVALRQALKTVLDQRTDARTPSPPSNPATAPTPARTNAQATYRALPNFPNAASPLTLPSLATAVLVRETIAHLPSQPPADPETALPPNAGTPQAPARTTAPMPPYRGAPSTPQAPAPSSLATTASPRDQAVHLLSQTDAAIARQTLLRIASLPADQAATSTHSNDNAPRLMAEIPVATAFGTAVAPLTIERDGRGSGPHDAQPSWLATFSIDLAVIGAVHVRIALNGERTSVMLRTERPQSAELLTAGLPLLDAGLRKAEIEPGELRCLSSGTAGNAAAPSRQQAAAPGMFLDQAS